MYSDLQMIIASQIAYLNVEEGYTIKEILEMELESSDPEYVKKVEMLRERINELPPQQRESCENWIVKDVRDDQHGSGMYACLLETGDGEALIGFRGSESDTLENVVKDWGASDFGLLNSVLTPQQAAAEQYVRDLYNEYGRQYDSFAMTGHSLGGNLAMHGTITAPDGMRDKIIQCNNLDGPGFSNSYIIAHQSDIEKSSGVITHNQWSLVGGLLTPVPGAEYKTVDADTPEGGDGILQRHNTYNVTNFDENGNMIPGEKDWLSVVMEPLSKVIDFSIFTVFGSLGISLIYNAADVILDGIENLWEEWQRVRMAGREAQFDINPQALSNGLQQASEASSKLQDVCHKVEQVQNQLAFDSVVSVYVKAKLWRLMVNIEKNSRKLQNYRERGYECSRYCITYDKKAAEYY